MPHRMRSGLSDTPPSSPRKASISKIACGCRSPPVSFPTTPLCSSTRSSLLLLRLPATSRPPTSSRGAAEPKSAFALDDAIPKQRTSVASHAEHGQHCRLARQPTLPPTCSRYRILDCHPLLGSIRRLASTDQLGEAEVDVACQGLRPGNDG